MSSAMTDLPEDEAARRRRIVATMLATVGEADTYARPDICRILDDYVEEEIDDTEVMSSLLAGCACRGGTTNRTGLRRARPAW
jgi:hypothetical protein